MSPETQSRVSRELLRGYSFVSAREICLDELQRSELAAVQRQMATAPLHEHEPNGNRFRFYNQLLLDSASGTLTPRLGIGYWQFPHLGYSNSGKQRQFASHPPEFLHSTWLRAWVWSWYRLLPQSLFPRGELALVEVHLLRTRPGPVIVNQFHKDGEPFFVLSLIDRVNVSEGVTQLARSSAGTEVLDRFLLREPLDSLFVDDRQLYHNVTPLQSGDDRDAPGYRDILNVGFVPLAYQSGVP